MQGSRVATELTDHITHPESKQSGEQFYQQVAIRAQDIADIIAFAVSDADRVPDRPDRGRNRSVRAHRRRQARAPGDQIR
jgi:hypothetical protein